MNVVILKSAVKNQGGLEKTTARIARAFKEQGANVSILTTMHSNQRFLDIPTHSLKTWRWPTFVRMQQFDQAAQKWLKTSPAQVVFGMDRNKWQTHLRTGNGVHAAYLQSRRLSEGKWKYRSCLANPFHQMVLRLEKKAFENPALKKIFANSHMVKQEILDRFCVDPSKICVVHNGVEWHELQEPFTSWPEQKLIHCKRLGLDPNAFHLLFIGSGYLRKGLSQLLVALSVLKRKEVHITILGKDRRIEFYRSLTQKLGLCAQVHFFGPQSNPIPFYQIADVLTIPSFYDPFANVTVEALAMGLFVVSSKTNGGSEVLTTKSGVIIEDLTNADSLVEALKIALMHPKTEKNAREIRNVVQHLDYQKQLQQIVELSLA